MSKHAQAMRRANLGYVPAGGGYLALVIETVDEDGMIRINWQPPGYESNDVVIERNESNEGWNQIGTAYLEDGGFTDLDFEYGGPTHLAYRCTPRVDEGEIPSSNVAEVYGTNHPN